jgi:NADH-quinone oxidoreductase subunit N
MNVLISVSLLGVAAMLSEVFRFKKFLPIIFICTLLTALFFATADWGTSHSYFRQMVLFDNYALAFSILFITITLLWLLMSVDYFARDSVRADHYALISFSLAGAIILGSFSDLTMFFIGIEIMSVSAYVLAGTNRQDIRSTEAALKYFIPGAFSTAFLLFGIALIYGATGSFNLNRIAQWIVQHHASLPLFIHAGMVFLIAGMLFKIAALPFHSWAPDVYDGSPTAVTAFMTTVIKAASLAAFYRLFVFCFSILSESWTSVLALAAALTILGGNLTAVYQSRLKRLLAYSSIAHSGYLLLAVAAVNQLSQSALIYYLAAYSLASVGLFTLVHRMGEHQSLETLKGFSQKYPLQAILISFLTLSAAGIPPAAGFFAKYYVFLAAIRSELMSLVFIGIAGALIGVYYYFRIIIHLYSRPATDSFSVPLNNYDRTLLIITSALTLLLGLFPGYLTRIF